MAFKLVGDQYSKIRQAQKKRVRKLLADQIPDNEVLCMRDGRYACLICGKRPVFDTITVLSIHRKGKKHMQAAHKRLKQKLKQHVLPSNDDDAEQDAAVPLPPLLAQTQKAIDHTLFGKLSPPTYDDPQPADEGLKQSSGCGNSDNVKIPHSSLKAYETGYHDNEKVSIADLQKSNSDYIKLRSSGWIPNFDGTWSKDPNAEFDSDEEEL